MSAIQKGIAYDVGTKFWEIRDDKNAVITEFNHNLFPHILSDTEVYFMDLDLDPRLCENVQVVKDVDDEIRAATFSVNINADAEAVLRDYVMRALLHALEKQGAARSAYLQQLRGKMNVVQNSAQSNGAWVTLASLAMDGIV